MKYIVLYKMRSSPDACYLPFLPFTYVPYELKFDKNLNKISKFSETLGTMINLLEWS